MQPTDKEICAGVTLKCNYEMITCDLCIPNYVGGYLDELKHKTPKS